MLLDLKEHQFILSVEKEINIISFFSYCMIGDKMDMHEKLLDKVSLKTNVSKNDILALANDLSNKNLKDEKDIKDFIERISKMANKQVRPEQMEKMVALIQNNKIPSSIDKYI